MAERSQASTVPMTPVEQVLTLARGRKRWAALLTGLLLLWLLVPRKPDVARDVCRFVAWIRLSRHVNGLMLIELWR